MALALSTYSCNSGPKLRLLDAKKDLHLPGEVYALALSPNGDRIAFTSCNGGVGNSRCGVYLRDTSGGETKVLFDQSEPFALPQNLHWSPDGQWLAYTDDTTAIVKLLVRPIAGGPAKTIADICIAGGYSWTSDSKGFIASITNETGPLIQHCHLQSYSLEGKPIARFAEDGMAPAVSPDGKFVAFDRYDETSRPKVFVQELSPTYQGLGKARALATGFSPVWISDGKELLIGTGGWHPLSRVSLEGNVRPLEVTCLDYFSQS